MPVSVIQSSPLPTRPVEEYFTGQSQYWSDVYHASDTYSRIYQERQQRTLDFIDSLNLPPDARILEAGCGAGHLSIELARRGFRRIDAIDSSSGMVGRAEENATRAGVAGTITFNHADVYALPHPDHSFDLVVALGVLPWLTDPFRAVKELSRIVRPGGAAVISTDNLHRLTFLIDPRFSPWLMPFRKAAKTALTGIGILRSDSSLVKNYRHSIREFDRWLAVTQLTIVRRSTIGFGPFTFFGKELLSGTASVHLHASLQRYADRRIPGFRRSGAQYLVLAHKISVTQ